MIDRDRDKEITASYKRGETLESIKALDRIKSYSMNNTKLLSFADFRKIDQTLKQFDSYETSLKCPLSVLFKIKDTKQIFVMKYNKYVEVRNVVIYEEETRPYIEYFVLENPTDVAVQVRTIWIDEYGVNWFLERPTLPIDASHQ